jgi:centromere/kinetochore protein ZW10
VDSWIEHAKALQNDIESSKRLASEIIRQAEADEQREDLISEQKKYLSFMEGEVLFNSQLRDALSVMQEVSECLERAEALIDARQILPCLTALEGKLGSH